jgi:integrase
VQHHSELPYRDVPAFIDALRQQENTVAKCLEFTILCACRSGEAIGAVWSEINWETRTWIIPAGIPQWARNPPARSLPRQGEYVFPGRRGGPHSDATLLALLERMNVAVTVHLTLKPEMTDEEIINATGGRWRATQLSWGLDGLHSRPYVEQPMIFQSAVD